MQTLQTHDPSLAGLRVRHPSGVLGFDWSKRKEQRKSMTSPPLERAKLQAVQMPFEYAALEPEVSAETMHYHYDEHYMGYLLKANALAEQADLSNLSLEDIIRQAAWKRKRALLVNAAQVWNHAFFWQCLSPSNSVGPDAILKSALEKAFGSLDKFKQKFIEKGLAHVGSGWLWLSWHSERGLVLSTTENAIPVWLASGRTPLLVCDIWEHAYYLDWKNDRAGWLNAFINECANWQMAGKQFASLLNGTESWKYPK